MRKITATITQRNQVTIPAEVRILLGLKPMDNVTFTVEEGGAVRLAAAAFNLESAYGSVRAAEETEDLTVVSKNAKDAKAHATAQELREA